MPPTPHTYIRRSFRGGEGLSSAFHGKRTLMCEKNTSCRWKWKWMWGHEWPGKWGEGGWKWAEENPQSHGQSAVGSSVSPIWMRWRIYHSGWQDNSLICAKPTQQPHQDIAGLARSSIGGISSIGIGLRARPKTRPEPDQTRRPELRASVFGATEKARQLVLRPFCSPFVSWPSVTTKWIFKSASNKCSCQIKWGLTFRLWTLLKLVGFNSNFALIKFV